MTKWTLEKLSKIDGVEILNVKIAEISLNMHNNGILSLYMLLSGDGWEVVYGGRCLGKGYVGAPDDGFVGYAAGIEAIMRIMDVVGVEDLVDMKGKYVRAVTSGWGSEIDIIGNIIEDKWFDYASFFGDKNMEK